MKIYYFNLNVGSGIENIGNLIKGMLDGYDVVEYSYQNPPYLIIQDMVVHQPDVILLNEFYPRTICAAYYYKVTHPGTRIIFINHCLSTLQALPFDPKKGPKDIDHDRVVLINNFFRNEVEMIINLNWYPYEVSLPDWLDRKVIHHLFPVDPNKFCVKTAWTNRTGDFLYFGNVLPHKLSLEFLEKFSKTNIVLDVYGKVYPDRFKEYTEFFLAMKNINYQGFAAEEDIQKIMNDYRFFISARDGHEPFMGTMAEVIMSGMIPLVANDRTKPKADWIDHYTGCYLEYQTVDELLEAMQFYLMRKNDVQFTNILNQRSLDNAKEMSGRTSIGRFKELLRTVLSNEPKASNT